MSRSQDRVVVFVDGSNFYHQLIAISQTHAEATVLVEKAVNVKIAVDMVVMTERDEYDAAYLLSSDGDLSPVV